MATTKFNRIAQLFMSKIGDPITITASVIGVGNIITEKEQIENYINTAMEKFFYTKWNEFGGNIQTMSNFFPELIVHSDSNVIAAGIFSLSTKKNFFKLFGCRVDDVYVRIWDASKYSIAKSEKRIQYVGSATHPGVIVKGEQLEFFGVDESSSGLDIDYLIKPLRSDGTSFTSSATLSDIPFNEFWSEQIAQIATDLYNQDAQNFS